MSKIITCPSGLTGRVRGLTRDEELDLKRRERSLPLSCKMSSAVTKLLPVIELCWEETIDRGPYAEIEWDQIFVSDMLCILNVIRELTSNPDDLFCPHMMERSSKDV